MKGTILGYDATSHTGAISGQDGNRYDFALIEWKSPGVPAKGMVVDFVPVDGRATRIYVVDASSVRSENWFVFLFSLSGRIPRKRYWLSYVVPVTLIYIVASFIDITLEQDQQQRSVITGLVLLFFLWPSFAVTAKRLHDRGMSGWW